MYNQNGASYDGLEDKCIINQGAESALCFFKAFDNGDI
jgi:hypothetical protein